EHPHMHAVGAPLEPAEPATDAMELPLALDDQLPVLVAELLPRHIGGNLLLAAEGGQLAALPLRGLGAPRLDGAGGDRLARIGQEEVQIEIDDASEAAARLTRAEWAVEGEQIGGGFAVGNLTAWAFETGDMRFTPIARIRKHQHQAALAE